MTVGVHLEAFGELLDEMVTLGPWADHAHVADQHVPQLRKFVERRCPQDRPDAAWPPVRGLPIGVGQVARRCRQCAELENGEVAVIETDPLLPEQHR